MKKSLFGLLLLVGSVFGSTNISDIDVFRLHSIKPFENVSDFKSDRTFFNPYIERLRVRNNHTNVILEENEILEEKLPEIEGYINSIFNEIDLPDYLSKGFIRSQIWAESRDYSNAVGNDGERGLMQLSFGAWNQVEKEEDFYEMAFDPKKNIDVGIKYDLWVNDYLEKWHSDWNNQSPSEKRKLLVAGYNIGVGRLKELEWNMEEIPARTKLYLSWIEENLERFNF